VVVVVAVLVRKVVVMAVVDVVVALVEVTLRLWCLTGSGDELAAGDEDESWGCWSGAWCCAGVLLLLPLLPPCLVRF